jgi:hypothetical protein
MLADCLTKVGQQADRMLQVMAGGDYSLVEDEMASKILFLVAGLL